jgi:hypothetical protein
MRPRLLLVAAGLATLGCLLLLAHDARAATTASKNTCSAIDLNLATGDRVFSVADTTNSGSSILTCNSNAFGLDEVTEGASLTLTCTESWSGVQPPGVADSGGVTIRAFADNTNFPAAVGTTGFWSKTITGTGCAPQVSFALYCTSDGTATGSPRHGPVRLYVSAVRSSVPTYSDDSDQGSQGTDSAQYGIILCKAKETSLTFSPAQTFYPGGQTVTESLSLASSAYTSVNVGQLRVKCGSPWDGHSGTTGSWGSGTSASISSTIASAAWPNGCASLRVNASVTAHSALSGYTSLPYTVFDASSADAASNNTQQWTDGLDGTFNVGPTDIERAVGGTVSYAGSFDGVNMTKCGSGVPTCANVSTFTISVDSAYAQAWGLRDSTGSIVAGVTVSCTQLKPDGSTFATITMGATDAHGAAPIQQLTVTSPKGTWSVSCSASWSGNTASYTESFFFASAYTADTALGVKWNVTYETANGTYRANVTGILRAYDPTTDDVTATFPDKAPRCTIVAFDKTTGRYSRTLASRVMMTQSSSTAASFWCLVWLARDDLADDFAFVYANVTGSPFVGQAGYSLPTAAGALDMAGSATIRGDALVTGSLTAGSIAGQYDISQANGMITTSFDPYVQPLVYGGLTLVATLTSLWVARQPGILPKLAIATLLVMATIWAATTTVSTDANAFRWVAVVTTSGWILIVLYSMQGQGVRR